MLDQTAPADAEAGRHGARERHAARAAAVALIAPQIERFIRTDGPDAAAVRVLYETWQVDSPAARQWREMYYALEARLAEQAS